MSMVPLMYRDWWDECDTQFPLFRSSRLFDERFGLRRDNLLSNFYKPSSSILRNGNGGYIRPWSQPNFEHQQQLNHPEPGTIINEDKDKFQVILDVQQFTPNEVMVKTTDKYIIVEGKHEEKPDEHGYISRHFIRRYQLPVNINPNDIFSSLSSDGVLTVTAPIKSPSMQLNSEHFVPIQYASGVVRPKSSATNPWHSTIKN